MWEMDARGGDECSFLGGEVGVRFSLISLFGSEGEDEESPREGGMCFSSGEG